MHHRTATDADLALLAEWNHQLIHDEGHRNPMTVPELAERMRGWIGSGEYRAVLFAETPGAEPLGYALYRESPDEIHLRQFFIARGRRREGLGRRAFAALREQVWPRGRRLTVDVLVANAGGVAFWRAVGYRDHCLTLEIPAGDARAL